MIPQQIFFLGVDAGGTKTHALISNANGQALGLGIANAGNWEMVGLDGLLITLQKAVKHALADARLEISQINAAGLGLAGFDWPSQHDALLKAIQPLGLTCPLEIVNDATLGILAGTNQGWGISVVAGTGCNCRGLSKDGKKEGRMVGGWSEWSHEYAGGFDIVNRALRAVIFEWNKRGPSTALSPAFLNKTGAKNLDDLVEGLYIKKYALEPDDVMLVFQTAACGDAEALNILHWAGDQLGQMACGVIRQLDFEMEPVPVVLIGSLFKGHPLMTESFQQTVLETAPRAEFLRLQSPPVVGSVLLGMEQLMGKDAYQCREKLLSTAQNLLPGNFS